MEAGSICSVNSAKPQMLSLVRKQTSKAPVKEKGLVIHSMVSYQSRQHLSKYLDLQLIVD